MRPTPLIPLLLSITPTLALALALPSSSSSSSALHPRDDPPPNHGYWLATVLTESGRPGWQTRQISTTYHNPALVGGADGSPGSCYYSYVPQGGNGPPVVTDRCDAGFGASWGAPWYTLNITQTIEVNGEPLTLYGGALLERRCGLGSGSACRAEGRIEAGIVPL